ncbi:MAG TPA: hypothetical protein VFR78_17190 [Pyrinomonadaceae bacterium]|nr:hypothetical protein [Pyrinomonadaceae bacterium]
MKLAAGFLLLLSMFGGNTQAQSIEYGEPAELQGITKIFVDTGTDLSGRDNIVKVIKNELPGVVVVSRVEEAEIVLIYSSNSYSILSGISNSRNSSTNGTVSVWGNTATYSGQTNSTSTSTPIYRKVTDGEGLVVKFTDSGRPRLLMNFKDSKKTVLERRPSTNFARKFVKVYKEVNVSGVPQSQPTAVSLYQSMPSVKASAVDLNGTWTYAGGPVSVVHNNGIISATYLSPNGCNGQNVSTLFAGQLQGTLLVGTISICTHEKLVLECAYPAISEVPFTAAYDHNRILITASIPTLSIGYDSNRRCTVTSGQQRSEFRAVLTRPSYAGL